MKNPRVTQPIATLFEAFNRRPTPATFAAYEIGLYGIAVEAVERAVSVSLQRCKFMPVPAELREIAMTNGGSYESMAERAFATLAGIVRRYGSDGSVNFADGAINATVRRLGGWKSCCDQPRSQFEVWYRKSFLTTYITIVREGASEGERRYLGGRLEAHNASWEGCLLPGGRVFRSEDFGGGIRHVDVPYTPALPAPTPQPRRALSDTASSVGLSLSFTGK